MNREEVMNNAALEGKPEPYASPEIQLQVPGNVAQGPMVNASGGANLTTNPTSGTTTPNVDFPVQFNLRANHVIVQNNTAQTIYIDADQPANSGSLAIAAGGALFLDWQIAEVDIC